jgi:hypothetical protein
MSGIGGLIGSVVAAHLDHEPRKGRTLFAAGILMGSLYAAFALSHSFGLALPLLALGACGQMFFMTMNNTVVLATVGQEMRGRVMAIMPMAIGLTPLAVFPVSVATDEVGAPAAIAVASMLMLSLLLLMFGLSPELRKLRLEALHRTELSPAQAARLVSEGKLSQADAERLSGQQRAGEAVQKTSVILGEEPLADTIA